MGKEIGEDGFRPVNPQNVGEMAEDIGADLDLFEAAQMANIYSQVIIENLKKGAIPCLAKVGSDGKSANLTATLSPDQVKALWRVFTDLSDEEMDERIRKSGFYDSFAS